MLLLLAALALHQGRVVSGELYRRMITPTFHNYGYGLEIRGPAGQRVIGHNGGMEGFASFLQYRETGRLVSVVLGNINTDVTGRLANQLADLAQQGGSQ
jgi:hypothetical protein